VIYSEQTLDSRRSAHGSSRDSGTRHVGNQLLRCVLAALWSVSTLGCSGETTTPPPQPAVDTSPSPTLTATDHLRQGREHLESRKFQAAEESFRSVGPEATTNERAEALAGLAEVMTHTSNVKDAIELADQALKLQPDFLPALRMRGFLLLSQKDYPSARASLKAFVAKVPDDSEARYTLAVICQFSDDHEEAAIHLAQLLAKKNDDHRAWYKLSYSQYKLYEVKSAAQSIEAAIRLAPMVASYHELACKVYSDYRPKDALPEIDKAISLDSSNAEFFFLRGLLFKSYATQLKLDPKAQDVPKEAITRAKERENASDKAQSAVEMHSAHAGFVDLCLDDLAQAIQLSDQPALYSLKRGQVLAESGRLEEAIKSFKVASSDPSLRFNATYERAVALSSLGRIQPALELLTRIVDGPDRDKSAVLPLALLQSHLHKSDGNFQEAIKVLETARTRFPNAVEILLELARLSSDDNLPRSLELAKEALALQPRNHVAQLLVVRYLAASGNSPQAIQQLQQFIQSLERGTKQQPQNTIVLAECFNQLGGLFLQSKQSDLAIKAFSDAIKHNPNNDEAFQLRAQARLYGSDQNLPAALEDLVTATRLNPKNVNAWFFLADLRFGLGGNNISFAKDAYSTVIRLAPEFLEAYEGRLKCNTKLNAKLYQKQIQSDRTIIRKLQQR